jgi:hypothetical protein
MTASWHFDRWYESESEAVAAKDDLLARGAVRAYCRMATY